MEKLLVGIFKVILNYAKSIPCFLSEKKRLSIIFIEASYDTLKYEIRLQSNVDKHAYAYSNNNNILFQVKIMYS